MKFSEVELSDNVDRHVIMAIEVLMSGGMFLLNGNPCYLGKTEDGLRPVLSLGSDICMGLDHLTFEQMYIWLKELPAETVIKKYSKIKTKR